MAFIQGQDEDELLNGQQPLVGQGSAQVGQAQGSGLGGPAGAGGQSGGWTNLQAYLTANQGDTGSAGALQKTVGDQFSKERSDMTGNAQKSLSDAQQYAADNSLSQGKVDDLTKRATELYSWGGEQQQQPAGGKDQALGGGGQTTGTQEKVTDDGSPGPVAGNSGNVDSSKSYDELVGQIKSGLTNQYTGARDYSYGFGNQTQEMGSQLKDNGGFDQLMNHIYSNAAGRPMSSGQYALQKQLDVNNEGLSSARQSLGQQYDQLGKDRDKTVTDTTKSLGDIEKNYYNNQNAMRDYIGGKANQYDTNLAQAEADARKSYQDEFAGGISNAQTLEQFLSGSLIDPNDSYNRTRDNIGNYVNPRDNGVAGQNWQDLQQMLDGSSYIDDAALRGLLTSGGTGGPTTFDQGQYDRVRAGEQQYKNMIQQQLAQFYADQEAKYSNLGQEQRGAYNVLQDFLGLDNKKQRTFNVRA